MLCACAISVDARGYSGYYWIDNGPLTAYTPGQSYIPVQSIPDGVHTVTFCLRSEEGTLSDPLISSFIKVPATDPESSVRGIVIVDGSSVKTLGLENAGEGVFSVDYNVCGLPVGLHNLCFMAVSDGGASSMLSEAWFYRGPTESDMDGAQLLYFIDGKRVGKSHCTHGSGLFTLDIDTEGIASGIHSIDMSIVLPNGDATQTVSAWFYKAPVPAGIISYDYWFNDEISDIRRVQLDNPTVDYKLIAMLDVPNLPFSSKRYDFSLVNGVPTVSNLNRLSMRFFDGDGRPSYSSAEFADSRTSKAINEISPLKTGMNEVAAMADNEIKWFEFEGEIGDSIAMRTDCAAMYELYSPSGAPVVQRTGARAESMYTHTLTETGRYYVAVHDVSGSNKRRLNFSFSHVPRNAILKVSPSSLSSSARYVVMDIGGNGLSNAKSIIIENGNGLRYETDSSSFFAFDNYNLTASFMFEEPPAEGAYSVTAVVDDPVSGCEERVTMSDAMRVGGASEISEIEVEVIPTKKPGTPYMVDIKVTNNNDIPMSGIPVNIACERDHGRNGFVFYVSDFLGKPMSATHIAYYESDNILGSGTDGLFFPLNLSYLHPHETRTLRVGITSEPHRQVGLYAWAGKPFSVEAPQILETPRDSLAAQGPVYSNVFDLKTSAYILAALDEIYGQLSNKVRARADKDNHVLENLRDYGPNAIGQYPPLSTPTEYADRAARLAEGYGRTEAGIVNAGAGYHCYNYFKNEEHIPGATLGEQIANIDLMYGGLDGIPPGSLRVYYEQAKKTLGRGQSPEDIANDALAPDWLQAARCFLQWNADCPNPMPTRHSIDVMMSGDPNMITGHTDPSGGNYIGIDVSTVEYAIEFENDPSIANAPACTIRVSNQLDGSVFDLSTFSPKSVQIGPHVVELPSEQSFVKTIDMRPEIPCIAEIRLDYSEETGLAEWSFSSLDPMSMQPVENYRQGLLPVNDETAVGVGLIEYSIGLKKGLEHLTSVTNSATIVFDSNQPIDTEPWINVTDYMRPEARIVQNHGYDGGAYALDVEASDNGSGIMSFDLYARIGDNGPWKIVQGGLTNPHVEYPVPEPLENIRFMVKATDCAGNRQISESGVPSGIDNVAADSRIENAGEEQWYNPQGILQKRSHVKLSRGAYISSKGRKIIVK